MVNGVNLPAKKTMPKAVLMLYRANRNDANRMGTLMSRVMPLTKGSALGTLRLMVWDIHDPPGTPKDKMTN